MMFDKIFNAICDDTFLSPLSCRVCPCYGRKRLKCIDKLGLSASNCLKNFFASVEEKFSERTSEKIIIEISKYLSGFPCQHPQGINKIKEIINKYKAPELEVEE